MLSSFALAVIFAPIKPEAAFYLLPTRAWELMLGSVLALAVHGRQIKGRWLLVLGPLGLILIAASVVLHSPLVQIPGWFTLLPTLGAVALILGGFASEAPVTRIMSLKPMVWVGMISYPLYLLHWPIRIFLQEHLLEFTLGWRVLGFALSFVMAACVYYAIETPVRRGRILNARSVFLGLAAGLTVATLGASWHIQRQDGVPSRFPAQVSALLAYRADTATAYRRCEKPRDDVTADDICGIGDANAPREVLVIGDSHALAFAGAFDLWLAEEGRGGALAFHHGCMPVIGVGRGRCLSAGHSLITLAERSPKITEVVLVSIWRQALPKGGQFLGGQWVPESKVPEAFAAQLIETVDRLRGTGKKVTIMEPFFAAANRVPETLAGNVAFGRNWPIDTPLAEHRATFATLYDAFDRVPQARRISLIDALCDAGVCRGVVGGRPLFSDGNHLAFSQSQIIADQLTTQMAPGHDSP